MMAECLKKQDQQENCLSESPVSLVGCLLRPRVKKSASVGISPVECCARTGRGFVLSVGNLREGLTGLRAPHF